MPSLNFSLSNNELISIESNDVSDEIIQFFKNNFFISFDGSPIKISLLTFLENQYNFNQLADDHDIEFFLTDEFIEFISDVPEYPNDEIDFIPREEIDQKLNNEDFIRELTDNQYRNIRKICSLRAAASFSVPGSGKTTEALAYYAYHKTDNSKLLVVCPINAFISWQDEIKKCFKSLNKIERLRGSPQEIKDILSMNPEAMIINYDALRNPKKYSIVKDIILENKNNLTVIFDESHKIKGEKISELVKPLSPLIKSKLILTGTPMPQASSDLRAQFQFLYPTETVFNDDDFVKLFEPIFVRTTKKELGLKYPKIKFNYVPVEPSNAFKTFYYEHLIARIDRGVSLEEIFKVASLKKAVLRLLKFFSHPPSCAELVSEIDEPLANRILEEGDGVKIDKAVQRAQQLISKNKKVVIWSSFVDVVKLVADRFGDKAVFITGDVETEGENENENEKLIKFDSREKRINRFKTDPECMIFVANPAAAAESISLHEVCDHAIYIDRTYNAGQFMQSCDRIHRLIERSKEREKNIDIIYLDLPGSVEDRVQEALTRKIHAMAEFLNDSSLKNLEGFSILIDKDEEPSMQKEDIVEFQKGLLRLDK